MRIAIAVIALAVAGTGAVAQSGLLTASDIESEIIGKRIYLATPFGGEFPLYYQASGQVTGDGEALGLGQYMKPQDAGQWWIDGDRLCQQFQTWYEGKAMCFELSWTGPGQVNWVRDNGETGTARIEG